MSNESFKIELDVKKSTSLADWYEIVVAELPEMYWMQKEIRADGFHCSRLHSVQRVSDSCVEGTKSEMRSIANAIKTKEPVEFRRCAVTFEDNNALFWSPRNSRYMGEVKYEVALRLADKILELTK